VRTSRVNHKEAASFNSKALPFFSPSVYRSRGSRPWFTVLLSDRCREISEGASQMGGQG
jgi:hypothetical protein